MGERVVRWLFFGVLIAVVPLICAGLILGTNPNDTGQPSSDETLVEQVLSRGELLLVSAGIAGGAVGEVVGRRGATRNKLRISAAGGSVSIAMGASLWYASISAAISTGDGVNIETVTSGSIGFFVLSLLSAGLCVALGES